MVKTDQFFVNYSDDLSYNNGIKLIKIAKDSLN